MRALAVALVFGVWGGEGRAAPPAAPPAAAPVRGTYHSPLGRLALREDKDGVVTASLVDDKNPCGWKKGTRVFDGARLDRSVAGTFHVCQLGEGCGGAVDADAVLVVGRGRIAGAVHVAPRAACATPLTEKSVVLTKAPPSTKVASAQAQKKAADARAAAIALITAAKVDIDNGEAEAARKRCTEAVALDPQLSQAYTCLGVTYLQRDRYEEALAQYQKAIEVDPPNPDPYYNIACIYALTNRSARASSTSSSRS